MPEERATIVGVWQKAAKEGKDFAYRNRYQLPDGRIVDAKVRATPLGNHVYAGYCLPDEFSVREALFARANIIDVLPHT